MAAKLYVGGLLDSVSEEELRGLFTTRGDVLECNIEKHEKTDKSMGFGYIRMGSTDQARTALKELYGAKLDGSEIVISLIRG